MSRQTSPQPSPVRQDLAEDLKHMIEPDGHPTARWWVGVVARTLLFPRIRAVVLYRLGQSALRRRLSPLAQWLHVRAFKSSGAEISPWADIGPGLCLIHSSGVVIGPSVRIGRNAHLYHGVTLGDGSLDGQPTVGDDVTIGNGASVLGGVRVGDRVLIGAHAVVSRDIPDDMVASGSPATFKPRTARHDVYLRVPGIESTTGLCRHR